MNRHRLASRLAAVTLAAGVSLAACGGSDGTAATTDGDGVETTAATTTTDDADTPTVADGSTPSTGAAGAVAAADTGMLDSTTVHTVAVEVDQDAYAAMIATYLSTGEKEWISATVTIDGVTYEQVGLRLKGNSSLRNVGTDSAAEELPWLLKFDELVDDQRYGDVEELVIRSNNSATALNEALALDLLELAGLASQDAMYAGFSVNGSAAVLRLAVENPDDEWVDTWFGTDGSLYKAESGGDYSYRGDDAAAYDEVFDLEAGDDEELTGLSAFLRFVNESDDATFAAELGDWLDVEAFARYLAMMELLSNSDDIDGPGNNSYLYRDPTTGLMTVVPWDMNLALGVGAGGGRGGRTTDRSAGGGTQGGGGRGGRSNVLVERFTAVDSFAALKATAVQEPPGAAVRQRNRRRRAGGLGGDPRRRCHRPGRRRDDLVGRGVRRRGVPELTVAPDVCRDVTEAPLLQLVAGGRANCRDDASELGLSGCRSVQHVAVMLQQ
ncbi:MAG: CotH kinase family protein [Ilumatobacteraceae bacterium]